MNKSPFLYSFAAAFGLLAWSPAVYAITPKPQLVVGATFNFDLVGANNVSGAGYYLVSPETETFGLTSTVTGPDGQTITISSSETIGATTTTDTFTLSTPVNFYNEATVGTTTINLLQFDIGDMDSGGAVPVVTPITSYTSLGTFTDGGTSAAPQAIPSGGVTTMVATGGLSYGAADSVNTGSATAITTYDVHGFTYSITYNSLPVPEPATWAMLAVASLVGVVVIRRGHRTA